MKAPALGRLRKGLPLFLLGLAALFAGPVSAAQADATTQLPFTSGPLWLAADPVGQHVFVSGGPGTSSIVVLNYDGGIVKTITGEQGASQMALDTGTHTLYVALHDASAISEIDTQTLTESTRFSTDPFDSPTSLVIAGQSPAGQKLWFSCADTGVGCVASAGLDGSGIASADLQGIGSTAEDTALATDGLGLLALGVRDSSSTPLATYDVSQDPPAILASTDTGGCGDGGGDLQDMILDAANVTVACTTPDYVTSLATGGFALDAEFPIGAQPDSVTGMSGYVAAGTMTSGGPDIAVYPEGNAGDPLVRTPVRTWSLETQNALPAHALAFAPSPSRPSELFAVVFNPGSGHMDFHVLDDPTIETTTSLAPEQQSVLAGNQATLTATVTGTAPSTGTVDLYASQNSGPKTLVSTAAVGSANTATFDITPTATTTYTAVLEAGPDYPSSTSNDVLVTVVPRSLPISVSQRTVTYGKQVKFTVNKAQGIMELFAQSDGGAPVLAKKVTVPAGKTTATFTLPPKRNATYFAERSDQSAASNNVTVSVRPLLVLVVATKRVSPQMVRRHGEKVGIAVGRKPALPGESLTIEIDRARPHGGWRPVLRGQAQVGASGIVIGVVIVKVTGRFRAQARFKGDEDYTSVKSPWRDFRVG